MQEPHRRHRFNPWVGKVPWRSGNPLQFCCLENSMDRGGWWAIVHRVAKSWTQLKWLNTYTAQIVYLLFSHSFQTSSPQPKTSTSYQTSLKDPSLQLPSSLSPFHETTQRMFYTIGCQHLFPMEGWSKNGTVRPWPGDDPRSKTLGLTGLSRGSWSHGGDSAHVLSDMHPQQRSEAETPNFYVPFVF